MQRTFSDVLHYFKSQRCGGILTSKISLVPLLGTSSTADVHGGWYDARVTLANIYVTFLTLTI